MAANYQTTDSYRDVQVISGTSVLDVQVVSFVTIPSGVTASRAVPYVEWKAQQGFDVIAQTATAIEDLISGGLAVSGSGVEEVDPAGLLQFAIEFVVQVDTPPGRPGPFQTTVTIPVESLTFDTQFGSFLQGGSPADQLSAARAALQATINA